MIVDRPRPLPECALCGNPTNRRAHRRNGGMCSGCREVYDQRDRPEQLQVPLLADAPPPPQPDLTNVVVLDSRRPRPPDPRRRR